MIEKDSHKSFPKLMSYAKSYANFSSTLRTLDLPDLHFIQTALTNSEKAKHAVIDSISTHSQRVDFHATKVTSITKRICYLIIK